MPSTYTFVNTLDNTVAGQVKIGASAYACAVNLARAINADPDSAGVSYSLPTQENPGVMASDPPASPPTASFTLTVKRPGADGNNFTLDASAITNFSWSGANPSGGTDGATTSLSIGVLGSDASKDLFYTQGSRRVTAAVAPATGKSLWWQYYRLGSDTVAVEDSALVAARAAIESGTGKLQQQTSDKSIRTFAVALTIAQRALATWKPFPQSFSFQTYQEGLSPGQLLTITVNAPTDASAVLNGNWVVQEVQASLIPCLNKAVPGGGAFLYTITVISTDQIQTYQDLWAGIASLQNRL